MSKKAKNKSNVLPFRAPKSKRGQPDFGLQKGFPPINIGSRPPDFASFAIAIVNARVDEAGAILTEIFGTDQHHSYAAAQHYYDLYVKTPEIQKKAMYLREVIENQNINEALVLLYELFGLQGPVCITVIGNLTNRIKGRD